MTQPKLKLCPFCGGEAAVKSHALHLSSDTLSFWGVCTTCGVVTKLYKTERGAIAAWNRRGR